MAPPRRAGLTTPTLLRAAALILVTGIAVAGALGVGAAAARSRAVQRIRTTAAPQLVAAQDVYVRLADADATESQAFLVARTEPPSLRRRYDNDVDAAAQQIAAISDHIGGSPDAVRAVTVLSRRLPEYTALVEAARADNRSALPVGAAYLHESSSVMRKELLPAATTVYEDAANRLERAYDQGGSTPGVAAALAAAGVVFAVLVATQIFVSVRTRRVFNPGLVIATIAVLVLGLTVAFSFEHEAKALRRSRARGANVVALLSTARIAGLRSLSDDNLNLVERGAAPEYVPDFERSSRLLVGTAAQGGLLALDDAVAAGLPRSVGEIRSEYRDDAVLHARLLSAYQTGDFRQAVSLATGLEATSIGSLDVALSQDIAAARGELDASAIEARSAISGVVVFVILLTLLALAGVFYGLRPRIREYS
jgi:hypothetical protein